MKPNREFIITLILVYCFLQYNYSTFLSAGLGMRGMGRGAWGVGRWAWDDSLQRQVINITRSWAWGVGRRAWGVGLGMILAKTSD